MISKFYFHYYLIFLCSFVMHSFAFVSFLYSFFFYFFCLFCIVLYLFICWLVLFLYWAALLTEEMEDIAAAAAATNNPFPRGWTVDCAIKMGVTYGEVLESLMSFSDRWGSKVSEKHTHLLFSISYAFMEWKRVVTMWEKLFLHRLIY